MTTKVFVDTNILIHASDRHNPEKQARSRALLKGLAKDRRGVISTQVMQEFFVAATRKLGMDALVAKDILRAFAKFEVVVVSSELIDRAIDTHIINRLSFWDALIVSAAESANCGTLWTEDLNHGQIVQGVKIENPLMAT